MQGPPHKPMAHKNETDHRQTAYAEKGQIFGVIHVKGRIVGILDRVGGILKIIARASGNLGDIKIKRALVIAQFQSEKNACHKTHCKSQVKCGHQFAAVIGYALGQLADLRHSRQKQTLGIPRNQIGEPKCHMRGGWDSDIAEKGCYIIPRNPRYLRVGHAGIRQNFRHSNIPTHKCHQQQGADDGIHVHLHHPDKQKREARYHADHGGAVGQKLVAVIHAVVFAKGFHYHIPQMQPRHPEHRDHQHDKRAARLPLVHAAISSGDHGFISQLIEPAPFDDKDQIEHPQTEQYIEAGKIRKEDGKQAHRCSNAGELRIYDMPPAPVNGKARKIWQKIIDTIPGDHAKCQGESDPEQTIVHKAWQCAFAAPRFGHHIDQGSHRGKCQAFVLHPLFSKNDPHTGQHHKRSCKSHKPPEQRQYPYIPRDGCAFGAAFKKPCDAIAIIGRNHKIGQMWMQQFGPVVVFGRVKIRCGHIPDQKSRTAPDRHGCAHEAHRQNGVPFPGLKRESRKLAHHRQRDQHGNKYDEHGHWNMRQHHARAVIIKPHIDRNHIQ